MTRLVSGVVARICSIPRREGEEAGRDMTKHSSEVVPHTLWLCMACGFFGDGLTLGAPPGDFGFAVASVARLAGVVRWPGGQWWPVFSGRMEVTAGHSQLAVSAGSDDQRGVVACGQNLFDAAARNGGRVGFSGT
jgi:hypothetical protein